MAQAISGATPAIFSFNTHAVRVVVRDGEPWFVANDVCEALGYVNTSKAIGDHLDDDERSTITNSESRNGGGKLVIINESGLYALVLRSRKPEARKFAKWVTSEVLPSIRKTGGYGQSAHAIDPTNAPAMAAAHKLANDYLDAYYDAIKAGNTRHHIDNVQPEMIRALLAQALMSQRMLISFSHQGKMQCTLLPGDSSVVSFTKDDYYDVAQHIPMERIPDMLGELSKRVGCHLGAFSERLQRDRADVKQVISA